MSDPLFKKTEEDAQVQQEVEEIDQAVSTVTDAVSEMNDMQSLVLLFENNLL